MSYASQSGRARTSPSNPQAHAICDRCGFRYNFVDLQVQYDWRGSALLPLNIYVCRRCLDRPQEQWRSIIVPADPTPIINARVQDFVAAETDYQTISNGTVIDPVTGIPIPSTTILVTQDGEPMINQPIGASVGLEQGAVMPLRGVTHYGVPVPVLSVTGNGTVVVSVTCSSPHGLSTNDQISVEGLSNVLANGFFSVTVTTATAFNYQTYSSIAAGALITPTTRMITAIVGLPYGVVQIPQVGP